MKKIIYTMWGCTNILQRLLCFFLLVTSINYGQTQKPAITTGVTFQWADIQNADTDPATLSSITINGKVYQGIVTPSSYALTRLGPQGHSKNAIFENGIYLITSSANTANWATEAIAAFQDKNLNHYFSAYSNGRDICNDFTKIATTDAQIQSLYYSPGIPSNDGGIVAITERNANNCFYISVYGIPSGGGAEQFLGDTFVRQNSGQWGPMFNAPPAGSDYWNSGRVVENHGTIGIALFSLAELAPVGSIITRVDLMAATDDHGDGKFFILQEYAIDKAEKSCIGEVVSGTVSGTNNVSGSTFSYSFATSSPLPTGHTFSFDTTDGSYLYTPTPGFIGDITFNYQVCLPAPNTAVCDTATIVITFQNNTPDCECSSGNANAPLLQD